MADGLSQLGALGIYLQELRDCPRLSRQEEAALAVAVRTGREAQRRIDLGERDHSLLSMAEEGRSAEERLARAKLPLVLHMAQNMLSKNHGVGISLEDLVLAGNEGLVEAIRRYDPALGHRFNTYAVWWIRNRIANDIRLYRWKIRIPDHLYKDVLKIMRCHRRLLDRLGELPSHEELARVAGMTAERVRLTLICWGRQDVLSLDREVREEQDTTYADRVAAHVDASLAGADHSAVTDAAETELLREAVRDAVSRLDPRQRNVISLRLGLEDGRARTLKEVGEKLGVGPERVRQIQEEALLTLRFSSSLNGLRHSVQ